MSIKKVAIGVGIIIVLGAAYYTLSPLLKNVEVQDELPEAITTDTAPNVSSGFEDLTPEQQAEMRRLIDEKNAEGPVEMDETTPVEPEIPAPATPTTFPVMGTFGHPAEGTVRVIETAEENVIRYENFKTINGPRLHVYLAKDLDANEFIDLGPVRGTEGNINYGVSKDIDLSEYRYIMYWCVPFSVLFNYADLAS